jgi:hypothetical protein
MKDDANSANVSDVKQKKTVELSQNCGVYRQKNSKQGLLDIWLM